ncbi:TPA: QVPTGV class sortase B protein-sorting domain-containing protein, partial [Streptococcus pyogenes]
YFDFSQVKFTNVGIYRYIVEEVQDTVSGIHYDSQKWYIDVYVVEGDNGFVPKYIVSSKALETKEPVLFSNSFDTTSLVVKKEVTGNTGDKTKNFKFQLLLKENAYFSAGQKVSVTITSEKASEVTTATIGQPLIFELKHNEQLKLDKLPVGITYQIDETSKNSDSYTTTATIQEGEQSQNSYVLNSDKETDKSPDIITVTNKRDTQVPTGVVGTLAPFAVLSIVAIGGVIYITKRKKA